MENIKCPFCEEQRNQNNSIIKKSRVIAETENFIVFPSTGGFVNNYQLIVPKEHINCFGELSSKQLKELKEIILWQKKINKKYFDSSSSMFEHGSLHPSNESGKSIVHAHLHIFPNNISLLDNIKKNNFGIKEINDISELKKICKQSNTYLYYSDIDDKQYIMTHDGIPSQFLRMILAESQGKKNWNWRENPLINSIEESLKFYKENLIIYNKDKRGER